ncbi:aspartate/glutamate racemase family protein [Sorangium sp. So ce128]|uniref:aspartate/glutamate racemase family protein n=1 Tax=Sorangium sp. So ce128 TaxID=3133281 RepID=UPI003F5EA540
MLAFLHTAHVHVETFSRLVQDVDHAIPVRHEVQESLLADALAAGGITDGIRSATATVVQALANEGARVIVCTCSTLGGVAEAVPVSDCLVMRIDRPMAEQAVAGGRRILVVAALQSTFQPTGALLRQIASDAGRSIDVVEVLCGRAWRLFERGDSPGYAGEIARTIEATALPGDLVLLAQASMAPAAELVRHLGIPVLSSSRSGVEAAVSRYRSRTQHDAAQLRGEP